MLLYFGKKANNIFELNFIVIFVVKINNSYNKYHNTARIKNSVTIEVWKEIILYNSPCY